MAENLLGLKAEALPGHECLAARLLGWAWELLLLLVLSGTAFWCGYRYGYGSAVADANARIESALKDLVKGQP